MFSFSISKNELTEYENEYREANYEKILRMEREAQLAYDRRIQNATKHEELES